MAVVNATFPTSRKTTKRSKSTKFDGTEPFDPYKNQMDLSKAKAALALYQVMK